MEIDKDEAVKDFLSIIIPRLVPAGTSGEGILFDHFLDVEIQYGLPMSAGSQDGGNDGFSAWAPIKGGFVGKAGVAEDDVRKAALKNLWKRVTVTGFNEILESLFGEEPHPETERVFVMQVEGSIYGAAAVLGGKTLRRLSDEAGCDLCVFPSSKYEVLVMPIRPGDDVDRLIGIHSSLQAVGVLDDERLSGNIWRYIRSKHAIEIFGGGDDGGKARYRYE